MKVVLAGGSGLIGRALCSALVQLGHEPVVLSRSPARAVSRLPAGARCVEWHPPQLSDWTAELVGAAAVINLAGESVGVWPWTARRKRVLRESRIIPTQILVTALAALPRSDRPRVLVSASGTDLYEGEDEVAATEETAPADTFLSRLCLEWEAAAHRAAELGVRVVFARTSLVIAREAPSLRLLMLPFRLFAGGPVGSGRQWMSWIDIVDATALMLWALEREEINGPLNLSAPDPRHQAEFAEAIGVAIHRPSWLRTPAWAIRLALGDQATLALGSRRVWPAKALKTGFTFHYPRLEDSLLHLAGDAPVSLP